MGKLWQIINVDQREASQHLWGELGSWFFYPHEPLLSHISLPVLPKEVDEWLADGPISPQPGPLSHMPVELLDLLFDELHDVLHDVVRLAITCKPLLAVGRRHLLRATRAHYAPWAGARLISLDDGTPSLSLAALPPRLLTAAEQSEIEKAEFPKYAAAEAGGEGEGEVERSLSSFAAHYYARVFTREWRQPRINDAGAFERHLRSFMVCPDDDGERNIHTSAAAAERDVHMFRTLYGDGRRATYPPGARVLCNLSKGEYVRGDGLTVPRHANLAHALLARICWSSSREVGMVCADDYRPQLTAGPWAGDRFCVTSLDLLSEMEMDLSDGDGGGDGEKREWRDVTREVAEVLAHIWENNSAKWVVFCK
ncbi:hypothetical protein GSI_01295 [Ganoderma sinense ZZ0214-1]|uniref:F-box domain-containing protein n=1 Tax=Ganoderma sinense ZZ0214-1 TaxID=1077348 RepID=A0A2G8SUZ4_9APHY|nr:hypothetical protein GSI_01295 [Ganoderma sinense ZZ0214-1]